MRSKVVTHRASWLCNPSGTFFIPRWLPGLPREQPVYFLLYCCHLCLLTRMFPFHEALETEYRLTAFSPAPKCIYYSWVCFARNDERRKAPFSVPLLFLFLKYKITEFSRWKRSILKTDLSYRSKGSSMRTETSSYSILYPLGLVIVPGT